MTVDAVDSSPPAGTRVDREAAARAVLPRRRRNRTTTAPGRALPALMAGTFLIVPDFFIVNHRADDDGGVGHPRAGDHGLRRHQAGGEGPQACPSPRDTRLPLEPQGVAEDEQGLASGMVSTALQIGGAFGVAILVSVASATSGDKTPAPALVDGYQAALVAGAALAALGSLIASALALAGRARAVRAAETPMTDLPQAERGEIV
jgi:hypothetical protein